ncbi:MAG: glycogen debranching enzyme GlgX [Cyanobacteria bacterium J149]|nr:MAG: glycogen debranching enzyme GlgX [Cyanobacteria bacterium J149]
MNYKISEGKTYPLGSRVEDGGVNFSLFSKHAERVELLLFDHPDGEPSQVIPLDPKLNKTYHYWHIFVHGIKGGQIYAYRVYGPFQPEKGHSFDGSKVLLDPYSKDVVNTEKFDRNLAKQYGVDNCRQALKSVVVDTRHYDWEGTTHPRIPFASTVIYEMHVGGFTRRENSGVNAKKRGTFAGLVEKIPYLKDLGVTAVELLPIHQFDVKDVVKPELENYWGYSTISFFAPHRQYSHDQSLTGPVDEFRDMVKAFHKEGIEVILDVVFNHTAEGDDTGPTICFKGLDNSIYYLLEDNQAKYKNFSGCGNTFKANQPVARNLIIDSLRYWVSEMHIDGFRFDLASILGRDHLGEPMLITSVLAEMESDPILAGTKLIAEAWDAAGLYQVGEFINHGDWFAEWNGPFRDDVRRFVRGDEKTVKLLAARILSSSDIYTKPDREPNRSIHFVTCHDGFTLADLVSYSKKNNYANGEDNRDGCSNNFSANYGVEGYTNDGHINRLRERQMKNFWVILLLAQGTPMITMGDEVGRSQHGNNNAYCQNNELSWFNWDDVERNKGLLRFVKGLIKLIQSLDVFQQERLLKTEENGGNPYLIWHGTQLYKPDWSDYSHSIAFTLHHPQKGEFLHVMLNAYWECLDFQIPQPPDGKKWFRIIDTSAPPNDDFYELKDAIEINGHTYLVHDRTSVVLMAK